MMELKKIVETFKNKDGVIYTSDRKILIGAPKNLKNCQILEGTEKIGRKAFMDCRSLKEVIIPQTVKTICSDAFINCSSLYKVNIPQGITVLEKGLFFDCHSLSEIMIPDSVENICSAAFFACTSLRQIVIPASVKNVQDNPFYRCHCNIDNRSDQYSVIDSALYTKDMNKIIYCFSDEELFKVADGTKIIGDNCFCGCSNLHQLTVPESVEELEMFALDECPSLEWLIFLGKIRTAHLDGWFFDNDNLHQIIIPKGTMEHYQCVLNGDRDLLVEDNQ